MFPPRIIPLLLLIAALAAPIEAQTSPAPHPRGDPNHWSFHAPAASKPPEVKHSEWLKNPIDQFILAELESRALSPSLAATKRALLRRVTLDLTGLLPTPEESDNFVNDASPDAYEKAADRLLASPRFGEHRAHYWLDYVRYGDTHGLHNDNYRDIWPYRDYII